MSTLAERISEALVQGIAKDSPYHKYVKLALQEMSNKGYLVVYSILLSMENGEDEKEAITNGIKSIKDVDLMKRVKAFFDKNFTDSSESVSGFTLRTNVGKGTYNSDLKAVCSSNECQIIAGGEVILSLIGADKMLDFKSLSTVMIRMNRGSVTGVGIKHGNKTLIGTEVKILDSDNNLLVELIGKM